jgi:hypothetical protein
LVKSLKDQFANHTGLEPDNLRRDVTQRAAAMQLQGSDADDKSGVTPDLSLLITRPEVEAQLQNLEENLFKRITEALNAGISDLQSTLKVTESSQPRFIQKVKSNRVVSEIASFWMWLPGSMRYALLSLVVVIVVVAAIIVIPKIASTGANGNGDANTNIGGTAGADGDKTGDKGSGEVQAANKGYSIGLRPDGWSLMTVTPEGKEIPSKYFANPTLFTPNHSSIFKSEDEAMKQLAELAKKGSVFENPNMLLQVEPLKRIANLRIHELTQRNINDSKTRGTDGCTVVAGNYGISLDDLKTFNKKVDCSRLDINDILVIGKVRQVTGSTVSTSSTATSDRRTGSAPATSPSPSASPASTSAPPSPTVPPS